MVLLVPSVYAGRPAPRRVVRKDVQSLEDGGNVTMNTSPFPAAPETGKHADPELPPEAVAPGSGQPEQNQEHPPSEQDAGYEALATYSVSLYVNSGDAPRIQPGGPADIEARMNWQPPESSLRLRDRSV